MKLNSMWIVAGMALGLAGACASEESQVGDEVVEPVREELAETPYATCYFAGSWGAYSYAGDGGKDCSAWGNIGGTQRGRTSIYANHPRTAFYGKATLGSGKTRITGSCNHSGGPVGYITGWTTQSYEGYPGSPIYDCAWQGGSNMYWTRCQAASAGYC